MPKKEAGQESAKLNQIISLCKRRGFIFPSSEIYGGFSSCYDYGPLGVLLKNNIKREWFKTMVEQNEQIVGLDAAILMSPKVWEASGHLSAGFTDPLVECKKCKRRFRKDEIKNKCPECGGELDEEGVCVECGFDTREEADEEEWRLGEGEQEVDEKSWKED